MLGLFPDAVLMPRALATARALSHVIAIGPSAAAIWHHGRECACTERLRLRREPTPLQSLPLVHDLVEDQYHLALVVHNVDGHADLIECVVDDFSSDHIYLAK